MEASGYSGSQRQPEPQLHLAVFGLPLPLGATAAAAEAAFVDMTTSIQLPVPREAVRVTGYSPHASGGRGCTRVCLPALAARAVLAAAPRLPAYGLGSISIALWQCPAEREFRAQLRASQRRTPVCRADAAATWRRPDTGAPGECEYQVEAFVAQRRVGRFTEYLVKWSGYELGYTIVVSIPSPPAGNGRGRGGVAIYVSTDLVSSAVS
ncbi:hypothetical protein ABPG75_012117 [Micractinium tetrahymenae]